MLFACRYYKLPYEVRVRCVCACMCMCALRCDKYFSHRHVREVGHVDSFIRARPLKTNRDRRAWKTVRAYGKSIAQPSCEPAVGRFCVLRSGKSSSDRHVFGKSPRNSAAISHRLPQFLIYRERARRLLSRLPQSSSTCASTQNGRVWKGLLFSFLLLFFFGPPL